MQLPRPPKKTYAPGPVAALILVDARKVPASRPMPGQPLTGVVRRLHQMLERPAVAHLGDDELLRRFVRERDETAFAVLTQRHAPTVWGVCRRILGHRED